MASLATKSKYKKAIIKAMTPTGGAISEIPVMFNPKELTLDKSNQFAGINIPGLESPLLQFVRGESGTLTMDLFFDSYEERKDVREYTSKVTDLMKINSELHAPPIARFIWADFSFTAVVDRVNQKFTMFNADGNPVRATLTVTFKEFPTEVSEKARTLNSWDRTRVYVVKQGDSLWQIAHAEYGKRELWRAIARINHIENPRKLEIGKEIIIPSLE